MQKVCAVGERGARGAPPKELEEAFCDYHFERQDFCAEAEHIDWSIDIVGC